MIVQMLIAERRDRYALAECLETYTEKIGPLLANAQGLHAAYLAGEEGESLLAIVTLMWTSREAAVAWLNGDGHKALVGTVGSYSAAGSSSSSSALNTSTRTFNAIA